MTTSYSTQRTVSSGSLSTLALSIEYLDRSEISVYINDLLSTAWSWTSPTSKAIQFTDAPLPVDTPVLVRRVTNAGAIRHSFTGGAQFTYATLDEDFAQILHIAQEALEGYAVTDLFNDLDMHQFKVKGLGTATNPQDAVPLQQVQDLVAQYVPAYSVVGTYLPTAGLYFTRYDQTLRYNDEFYAPGPGLVLPYTTTGVLAELSNFRYVGDGVLRSDLADTTKGAGIVGFDPAQLYPVATVGRALSDLRTGKQVFLPLYSELVTVKPNPADSGTWDWSPAVAQAVLDLGPVGTLGIPSGTYKFSGITTASTISIRGAGAGATILQNFTAGATMLSYTQVGMSDKERRNWLVFEGFTIRDEASFAGIGIKTDGVLSVLFRELYVRDFKVNYGIQVLEGLWIYVDMVNSDLCELHFKSTSGPHNNNVIAIRGGELRNPTPGRSSLYVENGDIVHLVDSTIEGNAGGPGFISGGKFKDVKLLNIQNTYFEVLSGASEAGLSLSGCQAVKITGGQLNSQSTTVPSLLLNECDNVHIETSAMVAFPIRTIGVNSVTINGCLREGPMDISTGTSLREMSPMPYNTRAVIVTQPYMQSSRTGKPRPFRNTYSDSSFDTAAPGVTIVAGAPVSSLDATQGYFGAKSWRVTGVAGDTIRTASLGVTTSVGQSGCMSFMAKSDTPGRFTVTSFLDGAAGGHDIYLSTEWRRYFVVTNLRPAAVSGATYLLQLAFQGTNAFNLTDIQFVPFNDYGEIPGIVDGFNYLPTHGTTIPGAISQTVFPDKVYFDRSINLRALPVYADNAAATTGGLLAGDVYRTATGVQMVRY